MNQMIVGTQVKLLVSCLGNDAGAIGVVYDTYDDFTHSNKRGVAIIFENGEHDGFSFDEQCSFLTIVGNRGLNYEYHFHNVMKLSQDYINCIFNFKVDQKWLRTKKLQEINGSI